MEIGTVLRATQNHIKLQPLPQNAYCSELNGADTGAIWMWESVSVLPWAAPRRQGETGNFFAFLFSPAFTCSWQHRNRMRKQAKAWRSRRLAANYNWWVVRLQVQPESHRFQPAAVVPGPPVSLWAVTPSTGDAILTSISKSNSLFC